MTDIVLLETPELNQIEQSKAEQIRNVFVPMADMLANFENDYNELIGRAQEEITKEITAKAKRLRINIGSVRIAAEKVRKQQKEEYLLAGRAIDGVANVLKWAVVDKENKLKEIEDYFEIQEAKRLEALQEARETELSKYVDGNITTNLSSMADDVWAAYLSVKKKEYEDRIEAEKLAEKIRIANERLDAIAKERVLKAMDYKMFWNPDGYNFREMSEEDFQQVMADLKKASDEYIAEQNRIREENERLRKEREEIERKAEQERLAQQEKARKEREAYEAKQREERFKREAAEAELKAMKEQQERLAQEEAERIEKELKAGDSAKISMLITDLEVLKTKYSFKSKTNQKMMSTVAFNIEQIILFINPNINETHN